MQDPFKFLYRDADVEGMSDGWDTMTVRGEIFGFDDPSMGWYVDLSIWIETGISYIIIRHIVYQLHRYTNSYTKTRTSVQLAGQGMPRGQKRWPSTLDFFTSGQMSAPYSS